MNEETNDLGGILDTSQIEDLIRKIDEQTAIQGAILGDKLARSNGDTLRQAIDRVALLKGLAPEYREDLQNRTVNIWAYETIQEVNKSNDRFNRYFFPVVGGLVLFLLGLSFIPNNTQQQSGEQTNEQPKTEYTKWINR